MTRRTLFIITALLALVLLIGSAAADQQITISNVQMNEGGTGTATIVLDNAPKGLAGFQLNLLVGDTNVVQNITSVLYPDGYIILGTKGSIWPGESAANPAPKTSAPFGASGYQSGFTEGYLKAAYDEYTFPASGATNCLLATITLQGLNSGTTTIGGTIVTLSDNDDGTNFASTTTLVPSTVTVYGTPSAAFTSDPASPLVGETVTFTDASTGGITSWDMDFGDGSAHSYVAGPWTHAYTSANTYHATLTVNNPLGPSSSVTHDVVVVSEPVPVADFTVTATNGLAPISVDFTDASTGTIDTYKWEYRLADDSAWTEFGGGAQSPTGIEFAAPGTYDIRLTVTNTGGSDTETKYHVFSAAMEHDYLETVGSGTVSGDLFMDSVNPYTATATQTFTLPAEAVGNIQWAQLYVESYSGSYSSQYGLTSVVELDSTTLGTETLDVWKGVSNNYVYPVNDHVVKVRSEYEAAYDVTGLITTASPTVTVTNSELIGYSFDGRIKGITLVVAYNDGDSDQVKYIVNHGADKFSSQTSSTTFDASTFASGWTSASMKTVIFSSSDVTYELNGIGITQTSQQSGSYWKLTEFDLTSNLIAGSTNTLEYTGSTLITTAVMKARYVVPPTANFVADKVVASTSDVVTFTDASTGATAWDLDFGDGSAHATGPGPWTHTYASEGLKTVILTVTNEGGSNTMTRTDYINVVDAFISFTPTSQSFMPGDTHTYDIVLSSAPQGLAGYDMVVSLINTAPADIVAVSYPAWAQFTNSGTFPADSIRISGVDTNQQIWPGATNIPLATITVRGNDNGATQIALSSVVMDSDGGQALTPTLTEGTVNVGTYAGPVASFVGTPITGNYPLTVHFDAANSSGTITSYQWDFDNNGAIDSTAANPDKTYDTIGTYSVKLTVSGPGGSNTMLKNAYITVTDGVAPTATILATPTTGKYPLTVAFSATTTGNVQSYLWNFGDGSYSSLAAPSHTYTYPGDFTASVVVTGTGGSSAPSTQVIQVTQQDAPVAGIIANPTTGTAPLLVQFYDQSTGNITSYDWDFGDGSAHSNDVNPSHEFTSAGTFTVTHIVTGPGGTSAPATKTITTTGLGVDFVASETSGVSSNNHEFTTTFTATATPAAGVTYTWDFGDGQTDSGETVTHSYSGRLQSYTVTVTATNGADTASRTKAGFITTTPYIEAFPKYDNTGLITGYYTDLPQDLNGDYVYEDVNGNGRVDYDDVVAFYNALYYDWFTTNTDVDNVPDYDYTGNGTLTTNDVVALYDMVLYG